MDAITILRAQLTQAHELIEFAMNDLTPEQLHRRGEGATIHTIATLYGHAVQGEDALLNRLVRDQPLLIERAEAGWPARIGFGHLPNMDELAEAAPSANLEALRAYAQAVYAESDAYLATLGEEDLDRPVTFPGMGDFPLGIFLATFVNWHISQHGAEIAALKGWMGGQGLPF